MFRKEQLDKIDECLATLWAEQKKLVKELMDTEPWSVKDRGYKLLENYNATINRADIVRDEILLQIEQEKIEAYQNFKEMKI